MMKEFSQIVTRSSHQPALPAATASARSCDVIRSTSAGVTIVRRSSVIERYPPVLCGPAIVCRGRRSRSAPSSLEVDDLHLQRGEVRKPRVVSLLDSGMSATEAALRAGFPSYESLRRVFARRMRVSPRRYQQRFSTTARDDAELVAGEDWLDDSPALVP